MMTDELTIKRDAWNKEVDFRLMETNIETLREAYQLGYDHGAKEAATEIKKQLLDTLAKHHIRIPKMLMR